MPWANGVHYDSEPGRRPLVHRLVGEGVLPRTYCTEDGVGLVYRGTELAEAVTERPQARAFVVDRDPDRDPDHDPDRDPDRDPGAHAVIETPLPIRRLR